MEKIIDYHLGTLNLLTVFAYRCFSEKLDSIGLVFPKFQIIEIGKVAREIFSDKSRKLGVLDKHDLIQTKAHGIIYRNLSITECNEIIETIIKKSGLRDSNYAEDIIRNFVKKSSYSNEIGYFYRVIRSMGNDKWGEGVKEYYKELPSKILLSKDLEENIGTIIQRDLIPTWEESWTFVENIRKGPTDDWDYNHIFVYDSDKEYEGQLDSEIPTPAVFPLGLFANILINFHFIDNIKKIVTPLPKVEKEKFYTTVCNISAILFEEKTNFEDLISDVA